LHLLHELEELASWGALLQQGCRFRQEKSTSTTQLFGACDVPSPRKPSPLASRHN